MLSAGNEIGVGSGRSARQYRPAKAPAATNLQQENDKLFPFMDDSSEPPSARIGAFSTSTDAPRNSAFFSGPFEQHLEGCAWFNEGVAKAVVAGASACPDKARLLFSLMANVESAINSLNVGLEMCEDRRPVRSEVQQEVAGMGVALEKVDSVRASMTCITLAVAPAPKQLSGLSVNVPIPVTGLHSWFRLGVTDPVWPWTWSFINAPYMTLSATVEPAQHATVVPTIRGNSLARLVIEELFDPIEPEVHNATTAVACTALVASPTIKASAVPTTHPSRSTAVVRAPLHAAPVPFGSPIAVLPRRLVPNAGDLLLDGLLHVLSVKEWKLALHMPTLHGIGRGSPRAMAPANVGMQMAVTYMFASEVWAELPAQHAAAPQRDATQLEEGLNLDKLPWEFDDNVDWGAPGLPFFHSLAALDWSVDGVPGFDIGAINWNGAGVPL